MPSRCKRCLALIDDGESLCDQHKIEKDEAKKEYRKEYYKRNKEKIKRYQRDYYADY
jgi:hypothetical protein